MIRNAIRKLTDPNTQALAWTVGGMAALTFNSPRLPALAALTKGARKFEEGWRRRNPDFEGDFIDRWDKAEAFYEKTHQDSTNRILHIVGTPMILGGALGLVAFRPIGVTAPLWFSSASTFVTGCALNLVGDAVFERSDHAFAEDPLSFLAGPVCEVRRAVKRLRGTEALPAT